MNKHTPGPWYVGAMPGWGGGTCILRRPASDYCGPTGVIGDAPLALVNEGNINWENKYPVEANARLFAAGPDLLEFAQFVLRGLEAGHIKSKAVLDFTNADAANVPLVSLHSLARAVITKATGEDA